MLNNKTAHLTPGQKLAKALKACKKDHSKSKRAQCERKAHSTYRAEMLAVTLKACKKDHSKSKRVACEKAARKKY